MSKATVLVNKVNTLLNKYAPNGDRTAYLRVRSTTATATEDLIGRGPVSTFTDTLFNPQPLYSRVGRIHLPGGHAQSMDVITASGQSLVADDYKFLFSITAITITQLQNPNVMVVLKDATGNMEELRLLDAVKSAINGADIIITAYYRSMTNSA